MKMHRVCLIMLLALAWAPQGRAETRNVILFIGDGMGPAQVDAGRLFAHGSAGELAMERMPVVGMTRTWSTSDFVTDSAAAGTALACGAKTNNGTISMTDPRIDPSGQARPLERLTDLARSQGRAVGVISTARVTHATPACFYAYSSSRGLETEIAEQVAGSELTLLLGGGKAFFRGANWRDEATSTTGKRKDNRDLVDELTQAGWTMVGSRTELLALDPKAADQRVVGLFHADHMSYELDRTQEEPSLAEMVEFAIRALEGRGKGYFLMVEAGRIDHAGHANDGARLVREVIALDNAVARARELVGEQTLIVVTADHETGALTLPGKGKIAQTRGEKLIEMMTWSSGSHSAASVPIFAEGPGAEAFAGMMDNTEVARRLARAMGRDLAGPVQEEYRAAFAAWLAGEATAVVSEAK